MKPQLVVNGRTRELGEVGGHVTLLEWLRERGDSRPWAVVATAHPAKFEHVVEPLLGVPLKVPPMLAET